MSKVFTKKILELDFGMGNIRSLQKAFEHLGAQVEVTEHADHLLSADAIVIPGDGAFGRAMENIKTAGFYEPIQEFIQSGKPVLGVCIGFQLLFESSEEYNTPEKGFGVFDGEITRFDLPGLTVPHMGWNTIHKTKESGILTNIDDGEYFYFVHSYRLNGVHEHAAGACNYGGDFTAVIEKDNVVGTQFHPEKSHAAGLRVIENFLELF